MNLMKIDKTLKYILFGAIFLIPFIPFIVTGSLFFPFITGKAFAFRFLVELAVAVWLILALRKPEYRPKISLILILSTVFVAIIGLADFLGENPLKSVWSNFERMEGLVTLVHLWAYMVVAGSFLNTEKLWNRFLNTSIVASVIMSGYGLLQLAGALEIHQGSTRLDATLGNSSYLAVYMLIHIFLALFFLVKRRSWDFFAGFYVGIIFLEMFVLYHTATRGAILGLLAGLIVGAIIISVFEKERVLLRKISIGTLVGLILLVGGFMATKETNFVQNSPVLKRFADISLQETTTKSRFMVWDMAIEGFKERPLLGWGQENFNYVFNKYYNPGMYNQEQWFDRTHNVFFDWLIAGGVLGLLGYLSLFFAIIFCLVKDKNDYFSTVEKAVLIGLLAGYFIHNFFVFDNLISYILFFSILGFLHSLNAEKNLIPSTNIIGNKGYFVVASIVVVTFLGTVYSVNAKAYLTGNHLLEALKPQGDISVNLEHYQKALSYKSFARQEVREQLAQFATRVAESEADQEIKQIVADFAFSEMKKEIARDPNNARPEVITGSMLSSFGAYDMALEHFQRATELSPNKQSILLMVGTVHQIQGDLEKARSVFQQAYELETSNRSAASRYAGVLIRLGEQEKAEQVLIEAFGTSLVDDSVIIQAYYETNQFSKIVELLEADVKRNPNDLQSRLSLAAAYIEIGQRTKAIEEIQRIIELQPDFKTQGEYYIQEIRAGRNP